MRAAGPPGGVSERKSSPMNRMYFDNAATTAPRREAVDAMLPFLTEAYANPSSPHRSGQRVKTALERARKQTAAALNARPT